VYTLADHVTAALDGFPAPLRVAVMGCVVNGPGEAREADLGVASGNGKGQIFVKGQVIATVPESRIVETLVEQALSGCPAPSVVAPRGSVRLAGVWSVVGVGAGEDAVELALGFLQYRDGLLPLLL
jgi:(E)-4-hydroxy-3-methylbut-2-enyl-diphosphate synthase